MLIKATPMRHQIEAVEKGMKNQSFAYLAEMGTGKSLMALMDYSVSDCNALIIFAPKGVYQTWHRDQIEKLTIHGETTMWDAAKKEPPYRHTLIVNIESLVSKRCIAYLSNWCAKWQRDGIFCIVDEATSIKNHSTVRFKEISKLRKFFAKVRLLTGSPVTRNPLDLYAPFAFLDPNIFGHRSFYSFRARYAEMETGYGPGGRKFPKVVGFRNMDELQSRLANYSFRVLKEDCLDLPPKIYTTREVEMTEEQKRIYAELLEFNLAKVGEGMITAPIVLTLLMRMQQLLSGHTKDSEGRVATVKNNRINAVHEILEETEGKIIIWTIFREAIKDLAEACKEYGAVTYYGGTTTEEREQAIIRFQEDPTCRVFIGNMQTAALGITLTAASTVIYYTNTWDYALRAQSEDRNHRKGQDKSVTYIDLICPGTVDEKIVKMLTDKKTIAEYIVDGKHGELFT